MPDFYQTVMGRRFFESTMPRIARALERIADALERTAPPERPARDYLGNTAPDEVP